MFWMRKSRLEGVFDIGQGRLAHLVLIGLSSSLCQTCDSAMRIHLIWMIIAFAQ
jgi:hypothetical protein